MLSFGHGIWMELKEDRILNLPVFLVVPKELKIL